MKKTAELPVAESVKLCIELDKEMWEKWVITKEDLEHVFEYVYGKPILITNSTVFRCMLYCYEEGGLDAYPIHFADSFSNEEIQLMSQRKSND